MNLANKITLLRIIFTFVFMFFLFRPGLISKVVSLAIFVLIAISDFYDGWIARRKNEITDFGKLMDPIADKIVILAAFAAFVQMQLIAAWMFVIVIAREILITSLRFFALNKGKVLAASRAGKHKTVSQMIVVFSILGFIVLKEVMLRFFTWNPAWERVLHLVIYNLMLITVAITLYSGISYLWQNRKVIARI
jgi:CDP-diacylglycerol--glycerol-3-phosphate 3-phosphatidyltransferase